jgi:hypothetical protein
VEISVGGFVAADALRFKFRRHINAVAGSDSLNAIPIASDTPHLVITIVLSGMGFSLHMRFSSSVVVFSRCYCCCLDRLLLLLLFVRVFVYFLWCYCCL